MSFDVLHNFISPVTGRVLSDPDYVLVGDYEGIATPSPILIDMRLELIDLRKEVDDLESLNNRVGFIISQPDAGLPKAQALSDLDDGFMYNTDGVVSTNNNVLSDTLLKDFLWIGDELNKALPVPNIEVSNLPNLTENKIWVGDNTNRPVEVDFSIAPDDAKYIIQQESPGLANAQILGDLTTGILKNTTITGVLSIASGGGVVGVDDYVTPLALEEAIEAQAEATTIEITEAIEAQAVITTANYNDAVTVAANTWLEEFHSDFVYDSTSDSGFINELQELLADEPSAETIVDFFQDNHSQIWEPEFIYDAWFSVSIQQTESQEVTGLNTDVIKELMTTNDFHTRENIEKTTSMIN